MPPIALEKPLSGGAVGEIVESRSQDLRAGDIVVSSLGWREFFMATPKELHQVNGDTRPLSLYLACLA